MSKISMRDMFAAGVHFGHQTKFRNPKMDKFIFGTRQKIHIIDLEKSIPLYLEALNFLGSVAAKRGKILFVGTKRSASKIIREEAERAGMPYVNNRWLGGMLTNYKTVRQSIKHYKELEIKRDSKEFASLTKKEALGLTREISRLEKGLKGIKDMNGLPDALFVIDVGHEKIAISEAKKLKIPVVGIVDTNRDPSEIDYVIPGNDDSMAAAKFYAMHVVDAILEAKGSLPIEEAMAEKEPKRAPKKIAPQRTEKKHEKAKPKISAAKGKAKETKA